MFEVIYNNIMSYQKFYERTSSVDMYRDTVCKSK